MPENERIGHTIAECICCQWREKDWHEIETTEQWCDTAEGNATGCEWTAIDWFV